MNSMSSLKAGPVTRSGGPLTTPVDEFEVLAHAWLSAAAERRPTASEGRGSDSVALFPDWDDDDPYATVGAARQWLERRDAAGFGGITLSPAYGGRGLSHEHQLAYEQAEAEYVTPPPEIWNIGHHMVLPAIDTWGTHGQRRRFVRRGIRGELFFCQLFSEPEAGSDLAGLRTRADRIDDGWLVNGQKVWTSVAHIADYGMLLVPHRSRRPDATAASPASCSGSPRPA